MGPFSNTLTQDQISDTLTQDQISDTLTQDQISNTLTQDQISDTLISQPNDRQIYMNSECLGLLPNTIMKRHRGAEDILA